MKNTATTKKLPYREVNISIPAFKSGVVVVITKDTKRAAANVRKWFQGDYDEWDPYSIDGKTISKQGYNGPVIWMREEPKGTYPIAVLHHESVHAASRILDRLRVPYNYDTEEVYAHLSEFIFMEVLKTVERKRPARKLKRNKK